MKSNIVTPANLLAAKQLGRSSFPHLASGDDDVWRRFLATTSLHFNSFEYDLRVGGAGASLVPDDDELAPMWQTLLYKRIDVVARELDVWWIIEVKPVANMAALGQVLTYGYLWPRSFPKRQGPRLAVVAGACDPDMAPVFRAFGVSVWLAPSTSS